MDRHNEWIGTTGKKKKKCPISIFQFQTANPTLFFLLFSKCQWQMWPRIGMMCKCQESVFRDHAGERINNSHNPIAATAILNANKNGSAPPDAPAAGAKLSKLSDIFFRNQKESQPPISHQTNETHTHAPSWCFFATLLTFFSSFFTSFLVAMVALFVVVLCWDGRGREGLGVAM